MNLTAAAAAKQYRKLDVEGNIENASPHRLIQLMMERALTNIGLARGFMEREETVAKGKAISDAIDLINALQASLNHKADARMAENFDALYTYMMRRLLESNLANDVAMLDEVAGLLRELKEAWDAIADQVPPPAAEDATEPATAPR